MKVMIVEDQTMIRSLLESYFPRRGRIPDHGVHSRRESKQSRYAAQILSI